MDGSAHRRRALIPGLALLTVSIAIAVFSVVLNVLSVDVVAASQIAAAGPESWIGRPGAQGWDVITSLGFAGALAAACVTLASVRALRPLAFAAAAAWTIVEAGMLLMVWHASSNTAGGLLIWQLVGTALLAVAMVMVSTAR
jgi:hypothetical protein